MVPPGFLAACVVEDTKDFYDDALRRTDVLS